jgi:hypothetical protein
LARFRVPASLVVGTLLAIAAAPYLAGGVLGAYFAGDDFQWLYAATALGWERAFDVSSRSSSYRPVIDLWFTAGHVVCDRSSACYHAASLIVHLFAVAMVFVLAQMLFRDVRIAALGTALFALQPAYTQAVAWVAAIPNTLGAAFLLAALLAQTQSWQPRSPTGQRAWEIASVALFFLAVFAHEASIVLLAVTVLMWYEFAPRPLHQRRLLAAGLLAVAATFAFATYLSNRNNIMFPEGGYRLGPHVVQHAFEFLAQLTVGPRWWLSDGLWIVSIAGMVIASRATRFSALWLLVSLTPYLGFTTGNVSRYHYVPALGFSLALAAVVVTGTDWCAARAPHRRVLLNVGGAIVALFLVVRFTTFSFPTAAREVHFLEPWREYARLALLQNPPPVGDSITVPAPTDPAVEERYLEPMLRWLFDDDDLQVIVERRTSR